MDVNAVIESEDHDLTELGLSARGDIIALRAFCSKKQAVEASSLIQLGESIKKTYSERTTGVTKKSKIEKQRVCFIGYKLFDFKNKRYKAIKSLGSLKPKYSLSTDCEAILHYAIDKLFPDGKSVNPKKKICVMFSRKRSAI